MLIALFLLIALISPAHADYNVTATARCYHETSIVEGKVYIDPSITCETTPNDWKEQ